MSQKPEIRAAVFDADGTLLDTASIITGAYQSVAVNNGFEIPTEETIALLIGNPLEFCYRAIAPINANLDELMNQHRDIVMDAMSNAQTFEGIIDELEELNKSGIGLGVFSSRSGSLFRSLSGAGIIGYFQVVVEGNDPNIGRGKPGPDGVLVAHERLGINTRNGSYLGDASVDIKAGLAADVFTIGVLWGNGAESELRAESPHALLSDPSQLASIILDSQEISVIDGS